ncbi:hypothetical protein F442_22180, partial [Phytophthora nicotianae P10297]
TDVVPAKGAVKIGIATSTTAIIHIGFLDGKNYKQIQQLSEANIQNAHYNGCLHALFATGTLCFSADGLIVWAKHNCPGS